MDWSFCVIDKNYAGMVNKGIGLQWQRCYYTTEPDNDEEKILISFLSGRALLYGSLLDETHLNKIHRVIICFGKSAYKKTVLC